MRYYVTLSSAADAKPVAVDVTTLPSGALDVKLDDQPVAVDALTLGSSTSQFSMIIGDAKTVIDLTLEGTPPELGMIASGHRSYVRVESERQRAQAAAASGGGGKADKLIKSPMPGRVVKVMVAPGDEVTAGQAVMVVEAMKMENELKAKVAGKVTEVFVKAGEPVEANAKLVAFG
jgi:biotin carboxyl carrier protein